MTTTRISSRVAPAILAGMLAVCTIPATAQTLPPERMNYQGVLRDQNGNPLTGTYDMVFRFMDAASGGNEILVDGHTAANSNAVVVAGGLLDVALGTGTVTDGSGPGTYTLPRVVFRDYTDVWLEIQVGPETLTPRTQIQSAPYAFNASYLRGHTDAFFLDVSNSTQTKSGSLIVQNGPLVQLADAVNSVGISVSDGASTTKIADATNSVGIRVTSVGPNAVENPAVFYSEDPNSVGVYADGRKYGIFAKGGSGGVGAAGFFKSVSPASATLAFVNTGGYFNSAGDPNIQKNVTLASVSYAVDANGPARFVSGTGVEARLADGSVGIRASGNNVGGEFTNGSSTAQAPYADRGIHGVGSWIGGSFKNNAYPATEALVAVGDVGIQAGGPSYGGYLYNGTPNFSYAYIPNVDRGITAYGSVVGGDFHNFSSGSWGYVGYSSYKILGSGAVSFVQNHPQDPSKVIVYAAPEGDEVAVYTRGSGRLVDGEARVALGGTFALVTNPDLGLTATATPRGEPIPLAVKRVSPAELVVQGPAGSGAEFDYMVWGLRIGFEEQSIVQPKQEEAKIPSMHMHAQYFADEPALREHTALARFQGIEASVRGRQSFDFSRAQELAAAIGVAPKGKPTPPAEAPQSGRRVPVMVDEPSGRPESPVDQESGSSAGESKPSPAAEPRATVAPRDDLQSTSLFLAGEPIEPGDVVSLAADAPGHVVRSAGPDDALLIGCAQPVETDPGTVAVASSRIALCRVDASNGPVSIGDRLTASPVAGMAMKVSADTAAAQVLGRALGPLEAGTALVRVLVGVK